MLLLLLLLRDAHYEIKHLLTVFCHYRCCYINVLIYSYQLDFLQDRLLRCRWQCYYVPSTSQVIFLFFALHWNIQWFGLNSSWRRRKHRSCVTSRRFLMLPACRSCQSPEFPLRFWRARLFSILLISSYLYVNYGTDSVYLLVAQCYSRRPLRGFDWTSALH